MKLAIMQPYFMPYIGYFQLISAVDQFVIYDNIKYTKKGWINRNRMLVNGADAIFALPLKKNSDCLNVVERELAEDFNRDKLLNQFKGAYARAPYFAQTFPQIERIVRNKERNLFRFLRSSIVDVSKHLGLSAEIKVSSDIAIDHQLRGKDKVLAICQAMGAKTYVNAVGGMSLYSKDEFSSHGITLKFIDSLPVEYVQFGGEFVPWLSIVDVMMFNPLEKVRAFVNERYELI